MKKATIYFKGTAVITVNYEKIENTEQATYLTTGYGDYRKIVAKVPMNHLIIFT